MRQALPPVYLEGSILAGAGPSTPAKGRDRMVGLAISMFIALFMWGGHYFGWGDPDGKVQLALFTCFVLGVVSGYKIKD